MKDRQGNMKEKRDSMEEIKILVLGAGGNVSQGIIKALRNADFSGRKVKITGACISPDSIGLFLCDSAAVSPYANEEAFLPWLIGFCNREQIRIVLTGVEENIMAISAGMDRFRKETDAVFVASDMDKLKIGQDKLLTCEWLEKNGLHFPQYCCCSEESKIEELIEKAGFPLIVKPRTGKGSHGVKRIENREELAFYIGKAEYVLQECIGDESKEYTVGCYVDKQGILKETIVMHRKLIDGSTAVAKVVKESAVQSEAERICRAFAPRGPLNIQMRVNEKGEAVCFELNVRFSGTTPMRAHFGYRDVEAMVKEYLFDESVDDCFRVREGTACRYVNELYMIGEPIGDLRKEGVLETLRPYCPETETMG